MTRTVGLPRTDWTLDAGIHIRLYHNPYIVVGQHRGSNEQKDTKGRSSLVYPRGGSSEPIAILLYEDATYCKYRENEYHQGQGLRVYPANSSNILES